MPEMNRRKFFRLTGGLAAMTALTATVAGSFNHVHIAESAEPDPFGDWLECDGSENIEHELPELFVRLPDGRLPDYRAYVGTDPSYPFNSDNVPAVSYDGFTKQPSANPLRYLIKARGPDLELPIGTIVAVI